MSGHGGAWECNCPALMDCDCSRLTAARAARRDQFAAAALTGLASNGAGYLTAAMEAGKYADALLAALDAEPQP